MITTKRRHEGVPQLSDLPAHGVQLVCAGNAAIAVIGMGKLVKVRPDLAQMTQKPGELLALDRRASHGAGTGAAESQGAQISPNAEANPGRRSVDDRMVFRGTTERDWYALGVGAPPPAPPRNNAFRTRF